MEMGCTEGMRLMQSTVPFSARWFFRSNASAIHSENSVIDDLYVAADAEWGNGACIESFNRRYLAVFSLGPARLGLLALSPKPRRLRSSAYDMYASAQGKNADGALPHTCKYILTSLCVHMSRVHMLDGQGLEDPSLSLTVLVSGYIAELQSTKIQ